MAQLVLEIIAGVMILLMGLIILYFAFKKFFKIGDLNVLVVDGNLKGSYSVDNNNVTCGNLHTIIYFDFHTLKKATKNFNHKNLLGRGGFGPVHLGRLEDGRLIAVKQLSLDKSQQGESEFLSEVKMITRVQHKNLVRLLGCCSEGAQRLVVYEYMKNKSLDLIVYGKSKIFLNWNTRFQIILGVARGLQYLHEDSHLRIIHRDIKASNILLDDKFQPRIGDFGLARFFPEDQAYLSTRFAGTLGYTAPEYAIRGELSEKADIYSFGVVALEIISGRKNTDLDLPSEMQYLPEYAWKLQNKSKLTNLLDPKLREDGVAESDVIHVLNVALLCLHPHANTRPPMSQVVAMLICKVEMAAEQSKRSDFFDKKHNDTEKHSGEAAVSLQYSPFSPCKPEALTSSESIYICIPEALKPNYHQIALFDSPYPTQKTVGVYNGTTHVLPGHHSCQ